MRSPAWWPTNTVERSLWERKLHSEKHRTASHSACREMPWLHIPHAWVHSWWGPENDPGSLSKPPSSSGPQHLLWSLPKMVFELPKGALSSGDGTNKQRLGDHMVVRRFPLWKILSSSAFIPWLSSRNCARDSNRKKQREGRVLIPPYPKPHSLLSLSGIRRKKQVLQRNRKGNQP